MNRREDFLKEFENLCRRYRMTIAGEDTCLLDYTGDPAEIFLRDLHSRIEHLRTE